MSSISNEINKELLMEGKAFSKYRDSAVIDIINGGQLGFAPKLSEWVSNQAYVRRQLIPILLEAPLFFQHMDNSELWVSTLKSLVELHCRTIEGFNAGLTVELDEHPVGGAGEMQQEFTDVKQARTEPAFTFVEKYGLPIQSFLYNWITYGLMDPNTKTSMMGTLAKASIPKDMLANWYSMSCLFIEPDPTHRRVVKSWVTTNMFPKSTGEIIGKRDLTSASEILTLNIEFTGISQFNMGTNQMAQKILDDINIENANPSMRPSFIKEMSADVAGSAEGYKENAETLGKEVGTRATV